MVQTYPYYLANKAEMPNTDLEVQDKYTGEVAYRVASAGPDIIDKCVPGPIFNSLVPTCLRHRLQNTDSSEGAS